MLRGYRFSMVDEMMNRDYLQTYGSMGDVFCEIIDEAPYEMAVLSGLMLYLTKIIGEKVNISENVDEKKTGEGIEWISEKL